MPYCTMLPTPVCFAHRLLFSTLLLLYSSACLSRFTLAFMQMDDEGASADDEGSQGFDVFISRAEMSRTLGILAEMNYVKGGEVNTYSTKFPYRVAANVSNVRFTWKAYPRPIKYSIELSADFDVLPQLHIPLQGYIPMEKETFSVEYRCAGSRSGQFQVTLHFNISWPSSRKPTLFTLRQEKICASKDGRRAFTGIIGSEDSGESGSLSSSSSTTFFVTQAHLLYLSLGLIVIVILACLALVCLFLHLSRKGTDGPLIHGPSLRGRRMGSLYATPLKLKRPTAAVNSFNSLAIHPSTTKNAASFGEASSSSSLQPFLTQTAPFNSANHASSTTGAPFLATKTLLANVPMPSALLPLQLGTGGGTSSNDTSHLASSASSGAAALANGGNNTVNGIGSVSASATEPKIIFERRSNILDINHALVELNADRNLFVLMPSIEMEGSYGELRWANWRQTGIGFSGDIDDEEDDAVVDMALIAKTLKQTSDRAHFEKFLREALVFHNVPAHPNLAQVLAAATFGNFINPDSVKDMPLICYKHNGFGVLKSFLLTCRGVAAAVASEQPGTSNESEEAKTKAILSNQTLRTHDLVSMSEQILRAIQHLHNFGVIHKDVAARNCLVTELPAKLMTSNRMYVQLWDNALSKDLFPADYHLSPPQSQATITSDAVLTAVPDARPVKWMAPEALRSNIYNSASDVWAFGVTVWELFTCGQSPYSEIDGEDMQLALASGARLQQPYNCPDEIYAIMRSCWSQDPLERPTTHQLERRLEEFNFQLRKFI